MMPTVDQITLNFTPEGLIALNVVLALIMFGVALDIRMADFRNVVRSPKGPLVAVGTQILVIPAIALLLTLLLDPMPSIALGMILVASCPSGNMSNFLAHYAKSNTPLSIGATAVSTSLAIIVTPLNLSFWGSLNPKTAPLLRSVQLDAVDMFMTIGLILVLPLIVGMLVAEKRPAWSDKLRKPIKTMSLVFFALFIVVALQANFEHFVNYIGVALVAVFLENTAAFAAGYFVARAFRMKMYDARAVAIETGIHNSGLGLVLVFNFFDGNGGMALVAAWWGIWHIVAGLALAHYWSRKPLTVAQGAPAQVEVSGV
jgi:bile acid:Na+ symporter, BASS family